MAFLLKKLSYNLFYSNNCVYLCRTKQNIMTIIKGSKKITIKEGKDGFGDTQYRATLVQIFNNGLEMEERFIDMKMFSTESRAKSWAKKQLV